MIDLDNLIITDPPWAADVRPEIAADVRDTIANFPDALTAQFPAECAAVEQTRIDLNQAAEEARLPVVERVLPDNDCGFLQDEYDAVLALQVAAAKHAHALATLIRAVPQGEADSERVTRISESGLADGEHAGQMLGFMQGRALGLSESLSDRRGDVVYCEHAQQWLDRHDYASATLPPGALEALLEVAGGDDD